MCEIVVLIFFFHFWLLSMSTETQLCDNLSHHLLEDTGAKMEHCGTMRGTRCPTISLKAQVPNQDGVGQGVMCHCYGGMHLSPLPAVPPSS